MDLHFTEFQRSACAGGPFRLAITGKIAAAVIRGLRVLIFSL